MDCYVTLILLFSGFSLSSCSHFPLWQYHYVDLMMTWNDAQHYCRTKYTDLATFESMDDINRLQPTYSYSWAWIGLRDDPISWKVTMGNDANSWRWSATGEMSKTGYQNWDSNQPQSYNANENCVAMFYTGTWYDAPCEEKRRFVCYPETNKPKKTHTFVSIEKSWADARNYCREHHTDLAMIENSEENHEVSSVAPLDYDLWIGLYRVPWTWSDKSQSSFRSWQSGSPDNIRQEDSDGDEFCAVENPNHEWDDRSCWKEYPFICQQVLKRKTMVKMTFKTDADISDPAANIQILQQLSAVLSGEGWTEFKLQWKIEPRKQEESKKPHCIFYF